MGAEGAKERRFFDCFPNAQAKGVYPANGLVNEAPRNTPIYLINPNPNTGFVRKQVIVIKEKAGEGVPKVVAELLEKTKNT